MWQVLGKLADRIDMKIRYIETLMVSQNELHQLDLHLCSCSVDGVMQEVRALLNKLRHKWNEWEASGRKGLDILDWQREQIRLVATSGSHDKMRSLACAAYKSTWMNLQEACEKNGGQLELRTIGKYIGCCWEPLLGWLCRVKADQVSLSSRRGLAMSVAACSDRW